MIRRAGISIFLLATTFAAWAQTPVQFVGSPLDLASFELHALYSNDFSTPGRMEFERDLVEGGTRTAEPGADTEWVVEGLGGAGICDGRLQVAPVEFASCGRTVAGGRENPSHMVVWNRNRFPSDILFEFTVNHHGSDNGLTLVFFSAEGLEGQDIFDPLLPPREAVYRNYNRGQLNNYTVSYWSRNKKPSLVARGEAFTNRIRKNPGANVLATHASNTDGCNNCDYRIRILKTGGQIAVEVDGVVVNRVTDPNPHGGGYIGLRNMMGVDHVSYDDFRVWSVTDTKSQSQATAVFRVDSEQAFAEAVAQAQPGGEVVIASGTYQGWSVAAEPRGSAGKPIVIRPEIPGSVVFSGSASGPLFTLGGSHFVFRDFVFEDIAVDGPLVLFEGTSHAAFLDNTLQRVEGKPDIARLAVLVGAGEANVFAGNIFRDSENVMALTVRMGRDGIARRSHIHHNVFENLNLNRGGEGTTTLQLASSGRLPYERLLMEAVVEDNYFGSIAGDAETISNKSNGNIIRGNVFINTHSLVIRQGHDVVVEDNAIVGATGPAIRVHGSGHVIRGNTVVNPEGDGIALNYGMGSGKQAYTHRVTVTDSRIEENLVQGAGGHGIYLGFGKGTDYSGHKNEASWNTGVLQNIPPFGNTISGNRITGSARAAIETAGAEDNVIENNTTGTAD